MTQDTTSIRPMTTNDYDAVIRMLHDTPGVSLRDADSREATARYLERNPGMSFVAMRDGQVVGCIMAGHDGRRGYLQHLAVLPTHRRRGIANALVLRCLDALEQQGIGKSHIDVLRSNVAAQAYWQNRGWTRREDIHRYSLVHDGGDNA